MRKGGVCCSDQVEARAGAITSIQFSVLPRQLVTTKPGEGGSGATAVVSFQLNCGCVTILWLAESRFLSVETRA
jgi:hypothetical protein